MFIHPKIKGVYDIACAEYCGLNHSLMYTKMYVVPYDDYEKWYKGQLTNNQIREIIGEISPDKKVETGRLGILDAKGCIQCHSTNGTKSIGPSFVELSRKNAAVKVDKKETNVTIDADYLTESITSPSNKIVNGYEKIPMPDQMNLLKPAEVEQLVKVLLEIL